MKWGLGLWFLLIGLLVAYVIADGFFDLSRKIRSWARPLIRRAWGAVVGVARKRAAPAAPRNSRSTNSPENTPLSRVDAAKSQQDQGNSSVDHIAKEPAQTPPNKSIDLGAVLARFWKWKAPLLALAAFLFMFGLLRGWSLFGPSRDTLRAELKEARADNEVLVHEAALEKLAGEVALETERDAARVDRVIQEAEQEIEDAVEADDFDRLYRGYRRAYDGVWSDLAPAGSPDPNTGRAAPVRGARSHTA